MSSITVPAVMKDTEAVPRAAAPKPTPLPSGPFVPFPSQSPLSSLPLNVLITPSCPHYRLTSSLGANFSSASSSGGFARLLLCQGKPSGRCCAPAPKMGGCPPSPRRGSWDGAPSATAMRQSEDDEREAKNGAAMGDGTQGCPALWGDSGVYGGPKGKRQQGMRDKRCSPLGSYGSRFRSVSC